MVHKENVSYIVGQAHLKIRGSTMRLKNARRLIFLIVIKVKPTVQYSFLCYTVGVILVSEFSEVG